MIMITNDNEASLCVDLWIYHLAFGNAILVPLRLRILAYTGMKILFGLLRIDSFFGVIKYALYDTWTGR